MLTLDGILVTGEALHAQAETARLIRECGGDYLFALKANRPAMLAAVETCFADPPGPLASHETTDADHGRVEIRHHQVTHDVAWLFGDRVEPHAPRCRASPPSRGSGRPAMAARPRFATASPLPG
jgi:hypothetical protein